MFEIKKEYSPSLLYLPSIIKMSWKKIIQVLIKNDLYINVFNESELNFFDYPYYDFHKNIPIIYSLDHSKIVATFEGYEVKTGFNECEYNICQP